MADDDIRDDGTVICPVHGMRYDPALTDGCIRCPRSTAPGKRSAAPPRSVSPKAPEPPSPSVRAPPIRASSGLPPRRSGPPIPFEPGDLGAAPYGQSQQGPQITILAGPKQRTSRRGLIGALSLLVVGGGGAAAWFLRPEGATDWSERVKPIHYGPSMALTGSIFLPTVAQERACPLLLLLDNARRPERMCTRYAKHCEEHGWIAACSGAFGNAPSPGDNAAAALFMEAVRANANVNASRPIIAGFDAAGQAACRLALLQPTIFSGAILECCGMDSWRDVGALARSDVSFFLFTRKNDTVHDAMVTMKDEMQRKGLNVTYSEINGGHEPMERDEMDPAFAWIDALSR